MPGSHWKAAEAYGFDMSVIESNIAMSPKQRVQVHDEFRLTADTLRDAMRKQHAKVP